MTEPSPERALVAAARGDGEAFGRLVEPYRAELHAHCYRMLGSVQDAEDALQEALLGAWRGLDGFEGRSSLRAWLYRITTNACLRLLARRPRRLLSADYGPAFTQVDDLGEPVAEPVWLEPYPTPEGHYEQRERVELAFVAALQHLPATQRAVLILREVLGFSAAEVARILDTTPASVNSALQRARKAVDERVPHPSQQAELAALGPGGRRELVDAFVAAWERADVAAILELLASEARFMMPPLPAWFAGRAAIGRFLTGRMFATPWRLAPIEANAQLAFACYQGDPATGRFRSARSTCSACAPGGSRSWSGSSTRPLAATSACPRSDEFRPAGGSLPVKGGRTCASSLSATSCRRTATTPGPATTSWSCRWTRPSTPTTPNGSGPPTPCSRGGPATWGSRGSGRRWPTTPTPAPSSGRSGPAGRRDPGVRQPHPLERPAGQRPGRRAPPDAGSGRGRRRHPTFGARPPGPLRLAEARRFEGSDNLLLRYQVGRQG